MSGPWEKYAAGAPAADGPWTKYAAGGQSSAPAPTFRQQALQVLGDLMAGGVRGAGSIGATIVDAARGLGDASNAAIPANMRPDVTAGLADMPRGEEMRAGMDGGLQAMGADPKSLPYQGGKLTTEVLGTLGAGGALSKAAAASGMAAPVVSGLASGGLDVAGATGAAGLAARAGTGALVGGASAGMVDPSQAVEGAAVGGAVPLLVKGGGAVMDRVGAATVKANAPMAAQKLEAARAASGQGYVIPPADLNPGTLASLASGLSGKIKTSQVASQRNQQVTNNLARKALGLADDVPLTAETLDALRKDAGQAYEAVATLGPLDVRAGKLPAEVAVQRGTDTLTLAPKAEVDSGELVRAWRQANHDATGYYRAFARDANPETQAKAKAAAAAGKQISDFMEAKLSQMGRSDLLDALRAARVKIAKSYDVESALNLSSGDVAAPKLVRALEKGKPLSGELESIAKFGQAFPKSAQALKEAPGTLSPLDFFAAGSGTAAAGPLGAIGLAARPAVRSLLLSKPVQQRMLADPAMQSALSILFSERLGPGALRALPVLAPDL